MAAAATLMLTGCGGGDDQVPEPTATPPPEAIATEAAPTVAPSACEAAIQAAAEVDAMQDTHEDVWPAFDACADVEEFSAAVEEYGGERFEGVDPATYVQNQCMSEPQVEGTSVCQSL